MCFGAPVINADAAVLFAQRDCASFGADFCWMVTSSFLFLNERFSVFHPSRGLRHTDN